MNASWAACALHRRPQVAQVVLERLPLGDGDRADAGLALEGLLAREHGHARAELREGLQVESDLPRMVAGEAAQPVLDIGGVTDLARLAVAHHVESESDLLAHDLIDGAGHGLLELRGIERLPLLLGHQQVHDVLGARQAADVRRQDSIGAQLIASWNLRRSISHRGSRVPVAGGAGEPVCHRASGPRSARNTIGRARLPQLRRRPSAPLLP